jgi:hypothetical protein
MALKILRARLRSAGNLPLCAASHWFPPANKTAGALAASQVKWRLGHLE